MSETVDQLDYFWCLRMNIKAAKQVLDEAGYVVRSETRLANDAGFRLDLEGGAIVNVFDTGKVTLQGKADQHLKELFSGPTTGKVSRRAAGAVLATASREVFVVYGHDQNARNSLEAMLRRWGLTPLILDQLPSGGQTIIEKLVNYARRPKFAVVLATPDDEGYSRGQADKKFFRARQNVVLELGMMLAHLGRENVAILIKQPSVMERPSDIQGLVYIPFENDPIEARLTLAQEMANRGIEIDVKTV